MAPLWKTFNDSSDSLKPNAHHLTTMTKNILVFTKAKMIQCFAALTSGSENNKKMQCVAG